MIILMLIVDNIPGVAVGGGEAHEAVGQVVAVNEAAELAALVRGIAHGLVVVANDGLGNKGGEVVLRVPAHTLDSQSNVGCADGVITNTDVGADEIGLLLGLKVGGVLNALAGEAGEVLLREVDKLLVGNTTSTDKNHALGSVVVLDVVRELSAGDVADVLTGAEDRTTKGLALEGGSVQVVKYNLLDLLLNLLRFTEDDVAFALNGGLLELRVLENIGENIDTLGNIGVEGLGEVDGVLALCNY